MLDEETESMYLVDFTQKIFDQQNELQASKAVESEKDEGTAPASDVAPPQDPDEEW